MKTCMIFAPVMFQDTGCFHALMTPLNTLTIETHGPIMAVKRSTRGASGSANA